MNPGQITLALTGVPSSSARSDRAQPTSPALVVAYGTLKALPPRPCERGDHHDVSAAPREHSRERVPGEQHRGQQVDLGDLEQLRVGERRVRAGRLEPGVVDQQVKGSDDRLRALHEPGRLLAVGEVGDHRLGNRAVAAQVAAQPLKRLDPAAGGGDPNPPRGERPRDVPAEPASRASQQCVRSVKIVHKPTLVNVGAARARTRR